MRTWFRVLVVCVAGMASLGRAGVDPPGADIPRSERTSPFEDVRWTPAGTPEVQVGGVWYEVVAIEGWPIDEVLAWIDAHHGAHRREKRFEEDLQEVMIGAGRPIGPVVALRLRPIGGGDVVDLSAAASRENRQRLWDARVADRQPMGEEVDGAALLRGFAEIVSSSHSYAIATGQAGAIRDEVDGLLGRSPGVSGVEAVRAVARMFGTSVDGHASVDGWLPPDDTHIPVLLIPLGDEPGSGVVGVLPDRGGFIDAARPFVTHIGGEPIEDLIARMQVYIADGSPALARERACRLLRSAWAAGLADADRAEVGVSAEPSGPAQATVRLALTREKPLFGAWPRTTSGLSCGGRVGYLRLAEMGGEQEDLEALAGWMQRFEACDGLIIDVRGNSGGSRAALLLIAGLVMPPDQPPVAYNAARPLRLGQSETEIDARMASRFLLRPEAMPEQDRAAAEALIERIDPAGTGLRLTDDHFAGWYAGIVRPAAEGSWWRPGRRVVVLMDNACFSATDVFLMAMKEIDGVTLVGRPSAGGSGMARGHRIGSARVRLSTMVSFQPDGGLVDGRGVQPDVVVWPVPTDFIEGGTDSVMDAALELLGVPQSDRAG